MNKTGKKGLYKPLMFIIPFLLCVVYLRNLRQLNMIFVLPDEYGYWMTAAAFSGYDWSGLSGLSLYYSYGYSILLAPLFLIFKDSVLMYKAAICLNALLYIGAYFISCACGFRLADAAKLNFGRRTSGSRKAGYDSTAAINRRRLVIVIVCGVIALYCNNVVQANIAWSEALLYFMFWLSFYTLLCYCENRNIFVLAAFGIELVYMYIIHQRMLGVLVAAGMVLVGIAVCAVVRKGREHKKQPGSDLEEGGQQSAAAYGEQKKGKITHKKVAALIVAAVAVIVLVVGFFVIKKHLTVSLWSSQPEDRIAVNNFSGQLGKLAALFSLEGIVDLMCHACGKFFYLFLASGSVVFWAIVGVLDRSISVIKKDTKAQKNRKYMPAYIYMLLAMLGLLGVTSIFMKGTGGRIDTVVYGRYIEPVIGTVMLAGIIYLMEKKPKIGLLGLYIIMMAGMAFVANYLMVQDSDFARFMSVGSNVFYDKPADKFYIYPALAAGIVLGIVVYIAARWCKAAVWGVCVVLMLTYWGVNVDKALDKGILQTHKYMNHVLKLDDFIDEIESAAESDIPVYYMINPDINEYNYIYRIFHLQYLRKNDTIQLVNRAELDELEREAGSYFLIEYHTGGVDLSKYDIVTQQYGLVLMAPKESELAEICKTYTDQNYYEIEGVMSSSATMTDTKNLVFDSDYENGFVIFAQDICLTPGRYQVEMDIQVEFDADKDAGLYDTADGKPEFPLTIGYADASYNYGEGLFYSQPVIINSPEELSANGGKVHVVCELICDEPRSGVELRFYSAGCSKITVEGLRYRTCP